jgi:hypothetical protein
VLRVSFRVGSVGCVVVVTSGTVAEGRGCTGAAARV